MSVDEAPAPKPSIPVSGDAGRYTMAVARAAVARVAWHIPENRTDLAARYSLRDGRDRLVVFLTRLNEPVMSETFDNGDHRVSGGAIDEFAKAAVAAAEMRAP